MKKSDIHFEGWYLKHQKDNNTVAFIPGTANDTAFIQVVTNDNSYNMRYPLSEFSRSEMIRIGDSVFSKDGIRVNIDNKSLKVSCDMSYYDLTPIRYDIMGPFKYLPMECRHGVISMHHELKGWVNINGETINFDDGVGYIEKDSGKSFPQNYLWIQCNDFKDKCSIMVSIADIPFYGLNFNGCICVIHYGGKEYRLATYLGVRVECFSDKKIVLKQGKYRLEVNVKKNRGNILYAPEQGLMARTIRESASCKAQFRFSVKDDVLFDLKSDNAGFEFV